MFLVAVTDVNTYDDNANQIPLINQYEIKGNEEENGMTKVQISCIGEESIGEIGIGDTIEITSPHSSTSLSAVVTQVYGAIYLQFIVVVMQLRVIVVSLG